MKDPYLVKLKVFLIKLPARSSSLVFKFLKILTAKAAKATPKIT